MESEQQLNLFTPEQRFGPLELDQRRTSPVVWVRRLVILAENDFNSPLQDISFRRGLNIVRTEGRNSEDHSSVAHDVGKTLLMRLLRFTLGEPTYGSKDETRRILKARPNAVVIAEWVVADGVCLVVRPLDDADGTRSYAVTGGSAESSVKAELSKRLPLSNWIQKLADAALGDLPSFSLKGKEVGWLDVLPWVARDVQCGFSKHDVWRDLSASPRGFRDAPQNRKVASWVMGMVSKAHANTIRQIEDLKAATKSAQQSEKDSRQRLQTLYDSLVIAAGIEKHEVDDDLMQPALEDQVTELLERVQQKARATTSELKSLNDGEAERIEQLRLQAKSLEDQKDAAIKSAAAASTNQRSVTRRLKDESETENGPSNCPGKEDCFKLVEIRDNDDKGRWNNLERMKEEKEQSDKNAESASKKEKEIVERYQLAVKTYLREKDDFDKRQTELSSSDARWQTLLPQAELLRSALESWQEDEDLVRGKSEQSSESNTILNLETAAIGSSDAKEVLQRCYSHVLTKIFGKQAGGLIEFKKGLTPNTDASLQAHGTALSAVARVIGFEMSCLLASMCGQGSHPRLLMHDGLRFGELEDELFMILIKAIDWLEQIGLESNPSFQYIITSANIHKEIDAKHAAVALTLHGRSTEGLLLKISY